MIKLLAQLLLRYLKEKKNKYLNILACLSTSKNLGIEPLF